MNDKLKNYISYSAPVIMIAVALILAVTSVWNDAPITDEIPHIGAGYSYIVKGDHRLNPEHPPLAKDLAGISLWLAGIKGEPAFSSEFWQDDINGQWDFGKKLIFNSGNDAVQLTRIVKIPPLIFFVLCAILIFIWTRKMYGRKAALMALFLFSFSPTVLAHSRFVTTDVPALFGILLGTYFFLEYLKKPTNKNLWLAGLMFGVAQLTKYSVFLLVPFFLGLAVIYGLLSAKGGSASGGNFFLLRMRNSLFVILNTVFIIAIGYIFVVWPVYYFHTWHYPPERQQADATYMLGSYGNRTIPDAVIYLSDKPVIRGLAEYATGLLMVTQRSIGGNTTYFLGEIRNWAWPHYFPIVYLLKEPLAFWLLLLMAILYWLAKMKFPISNFQFPKIRDWAKNHFTELVMVLWIIAYWYTSIRSNLNIGVRHLMPVYGFTLILLAGHIARITNYELRIDDKKIKAGAILIFTLFASYLLENLRIFPYYLTYFNQIASIRPPWAPGTGEGYIPGGHHYVVDSNLDWGQDLKRLADWVNGKDIQKIHLDYFGWSDPSYYMKGKVVQLSSEKYSSIENFLAQNPDGGYIAVSASFFMGSREKPETSYAWLDSYKPIKIIGNSIFVWYISPLNR